MKCKNYLLSRGWLEDTDLLPTLWMFRKSPGATSLHFLTPKGEQILSTKEANKYLVRHGIEHEISSKKLQKKIAHKNNDEIDKEVKDSFLGGLVKRETDITSKTDIKLEGDIKEGKVGIGGDLKEEE